MAVSFLFVQDTTDACKRIVNELAERKIFDINDEAVSREEHSGAVRDGEYDGRRSLEAIPTVGAAGSECGESHFRSVHQHPPDRLNENAQHQLQGETETRKGDLLEGSPSETWAARFGCDRQQSRNKKSSATCGPHGYKIEKGLAAARALAEEHSIQLPLASSAELVKPSYRKRQKRRLSKLMLSSCKNDKQKTPEPPSWEAATLDFLRKVHHEANEFEIYEYTLKRFNRRSVHRCLSELRSSVAMTHSNCLDPLRDMPSESVGLLKKENSDAQSLHAEVKKSLAHDGTGAMCASVSVKKDVDDSIPYHANLSREIYVISDDDDDVTPRGTGTPYLRLDGYEENDGEPDVSDDELKRFFYEANEVILFFRGHLCGGEATPPVSTASITVATPAGASTFAIDNLQTEPSMDSMRAPTGAADGVVSKLLPTFFEKTPCAQSKDVANETKATCKQEALSHKLESSSPPEMHKPKWRRLTLTRHTAEDPKVESGNLNQDHSALDGDMLVKESVESPPLYMGVEARFSHLAKGIIGS